MPEPKKRNRHIEDDHQVALFEWAAYIPTVKDLLFHIPNGGKRDAKEGARLKRQGVKAGVSDNFLPYPVGRYSGLWIELKPPIVKGERKPTTSPNQQDWIDLMNQAGYSAAVCYGWSDARYLILKYMAGELK